jgi:uncharacterized membrane protein YkvA (DUF1232 family)
MLLIGGLLVFALGIGMALLLLWRVADEESRGLIRRVWQLSLKRKLRLALSLARDRRISLLVRLVPAALVIYLAMPLDLIPDFVPVLGQLDDVLVGAAGIVLLLRFVPRVVLIEKLEQLTT